MNSPCLPLNQLLLLVIHSVAYPQKCSDISQNHLRGESFCGKKTNYTCLQDTETGSIKEFCKNETLEQAPPGQKYVWTNNLRNIRCADGRFQPYALWENENSECIFDKSRCTEEGQLVFDDKSTEEDRTCQCDTTQGYTFVSITVNGNYCIPWLHDCTCYFSKKSNLTSEYNSFTRGQTTLSPLLIDNRTTEETHLSEKYDGKPKVPDRVGLAFIIPLVFFTIVLAGVFLWITYCFYSSKKLDEFLTVQIATEPTCYTNISSGIETKIDVDATNVADEPDNPSCYTSIPRAPNDNPVLTIVKTETEPTCNANISSGIETKIDVDATSVGDEPDNSSCYTSIPRAPRIPVVIHCNNMFHGIAGSCVTLKCSIQSQGQTITSLRWSFTSETRRIADLTIRPEKYIGSSIQKPSLTINNLTPEDEGRYTCHIISTDSCEEKSKSCTLEIKVEKPMIFVSTDRFTGIAGSSITLTCYVVSYYSDIKCIEWFYQNNTSAQKQYLEIDGIKYLGGTSKDIKLTINDLTSTDAGIYTCRATNGVGSNTSDMITLDITLEPPEVLTYQRSHSEFAGSDITLFVDVVSYCSTLNVEWIMKKGKTETIINTTEKKEKYTTGGPVQHPFLTIHDLSQNDTGIYRCQATDKGGTKCGEIYVGVKGTAPFVISESTTYAVDDEIVSAIIFLVISVPGPSELFFEKNEDGIVTPITATGSFKTHVNGLEIYYIEAYESAIYICEAKNAIGFGRSQTTFVKRTHDFRDKIKMVVAIDIGTMYSKCAFSTIDEFKNDQMNICTNRIQRSGQRLLEPTCILLHKSKSEYVRFGNDAQKEYESCIIWEDTSNYLFFENFKTGLYRKEDNIDDIQIEEAGGDSLPTVDVFTAVIKALRNMVEQEIHERKINISRNKILWVLTIPSIWFSKANDFLVKCCEKAGILEKRVITILESKAASIYSASLPTTTMSGLDESPLKISGNQYAVIDIGGTTCQLSAFERIDDDEFKELCPSTVVPCAGKLLDLKILDFLEEIVHDRVMDTLQKEEKASYIDIIRQFESEKRMSSAQVTSLSLTVSVNILDKLCRRFIGKSFGEALKDSGKSDKVNLKGDKLQIKADQMEKLFDKVATDITEEIKKFVDAIEPTTSIDTFLLVGGFSDCAFVRKAIEESFTNCKIIRTDDSEFSVAKGAVLFGCKPNIVTTRVSQVVYGRRISPKFVAESENLCRDLFEIILEKNKYVPVGFKVNFTQRDNNVEIYASYNENTLYIDEEGCKLLYKFQVNINHAYQTIDTDTTNEIDVEMEFDKRELIIKAIDGKQGTEECIRFPLIV